MKTSITVLLFLLCNIIGFFTGSFIYAIAQIYKFIDIENSGFTLASMKYEMGFVLMVWLACAIFSFVSFFLSSLKWKMAFLLFPIIIPLLSSIMFLSAYM